MLILRIFIVCLLSLFLFGCGQHQSDSYYIRHPSNLKAILAHCETLNVKQIKQNQRCVLAIHTFRRLVALTHDFMRNQATFGKRILSAQIKQVKLLNQIEAMKAQLKSSRIKAADKKEIKRKTADIRRQADALKEQIHTMSTLIAVSEGF